MATRPIQFPDMEERRTLKPELLRQTKYLDNIELVNR